MTALFRMMPNGETIFLDRTARKLEAAALAVSKEEGFEYTGSDFLGDAEINPRAAKFVRIAKAAVEAHRKAK